MAIPSSPPISCHQLPSSPPLIPLPPLNIRKRSRGVIEEDFSSDPIFSDDGSELDGQSNTRKKRHYRGPWWLPPTAIVNSKQKLSKFVDSGVWLSSEGSEENLELANPTSKPTRNVRMPCPSILPTNHSRGLDIVGQTDENKQRTYRRSVKAKIDRVLPGLDLAEQIINQCVEKGKEDVDLSYVSSPSIKEIKSYTNSQFSDMALEVLPDEILKPLHQLMNIHRLDYAHSPDSPYFVSFTPELRIYLRKNQLREVPREICRLKNVTTLSFLNNNIKELPHTIGDLKDLQELNIAGNEIRWLPYSLLPLLQKEKDSHPLRIVTSPNPLLSPCQFDGPTIHRWTDIYPFVFARQFSEGNFANLTTDEQVFSTMVSRLVSAWQRRGDGTPNEDTKPTFIASSNIHYFDPVGQLCRTTSSLDYDLTLTKSFEVNLTAKPNAPEPSDRSPSLIELASRSLLRSPTPFPDMLREIELQILENPYQLPTSVNRVLGILRDLSNEDLPRCSVCEKQYVIKRAQWMEYWSVNSPHSGERTVLSAENIFLPFMREACSWKCVEDVWQERSKEEV